MKEDLTKEDGKKYLTKVQAHDDGIGTDVWGADVSMQSNLIIIARKNGITIFDGSSLLPIKTLMPQDPYIPTSLSFSKDGKSFLCWNKHGTVDLWDIDSGIRKTIYTDDDWDKSNQVIYVDENLGLLHDKLDSNFESMDPEWRKSNLLFLNLQICEVEEKWVLRRHYNKVILTTDNLLICSSESNNIDVYNYTNREFLKNFETDFSVYTAKLAQDKSYLLCSGYNNAVHVFDFNKGNLIKKIETNSRQVRDFVLTSDKRYLAVCEYTSNSSYQGSLLYFELAGGKCLGRILCGKFITYAHIDETQHTFLTVDNNGLNLIHYEGYVVKVPTLVELCVDKISNNLSFFSTLKMTALQQDVLTQYFEVEEVDTESPNNK